VLCDADGKITALDAVHGGPFDGALTLGEPVESCVVSVDAFAPTGQPADPGPLVAQIRRGLANRDLELASGQTLLMRELANLNDAAGTALLLEMVADPRTTPAAREELRGALANRRSGARELITALEKHFDFLHDTAAPPVGPMASALAAMKEGGAATVLTAHLLDPADSDKDVRDVATALMTLAGPAEVPALKQFFALYRDAPPEPEELVLAEGIVGETLLRVGGSEGEAIVKAAIAHPATNGAVRAKLQAVLDARSLQREAPSTKPSSTSRE